MTEPENLVRTRGRYLAVRRTMVSLIILVVALILLILLFTAWEGHRTREHLLDCITPGSSCYEQGQERAREAVRQANRDGIERESITRDYAVLAAYCADKSEPQTVSQIERCINRRLDQER